MVLEHRELPSASSSGLGAGLPKPQQGPPRAGNVRLPVCHGMCQIASRAMGAVSCIRTWPRLGLGLIGTYECPGISLEGGLMNHRRLVLLTCIVWVSPAAATESPRSLANQPPSQHLSSQLFRHCKFDAVGSRSYCAGECGSGYQFYYCSEKSFGCCHVGVGYCDWNLSLRCSPWRWTW